ncbi:ribosome recycling factor domain-containing protein [Ampelomyces quisqualis]|uniref:Ribosome recycling factor domain-containing protein n=1 Tax=Ampelomyces quisqualis TaxID=50730 RepID=A0A6A5Q6Z4_AMPQU|nr:ribosome recycling factor domain-containing protein [Ampelomyces quisqualis]
MSGIGNVRAAIRLGSTRPTRVPSRAIGPLSRLTSHHITAPPSIFGARRSFSTSSPLHKKAGKANKAHAQGASSPPVKNPGQPTATDEAYDVSGLEAQILKAIEKLTHDLSQLRGGGKLSPEVVESLKVQLGGGKQGKETVRLGDIAQVVPRGRMLNVICGEDVHIKPISSAIAASPHSLTPLSPEPSSPLTIPVPLPPPTGESRRAAVDAAIKASAKADKEVQMARQEHNKQLRKFELNRDVLPDDLQKAKKRMEDVVKKGHTEIKRISDGAKKVLESQ